MKLYRVVSEDGTQYVEADNFGAAVKLWRIWFHDSEPETVECVSTEVVIR